MGFDLAGSAMGDRRGKIAIENPRWYSPPSTAHFFVLLKGR